MLISPKRDGALVPSAPAGQVRFFVDAEGRPSTKDENGNVTLLQGSDGQSAYQIAVNNGFEGTEAEWLASLQGAPGQDGEDGTGGGGAGPVTSLTASSVNGEVSIDTSSNGTTIVTVDQSITDLSFSALPGPGEQTENLLILVQPDFPGTFWDVALSPDWGWPGNVQPEGNSMSWHAAFIRVRVIGTGGNPIITAEFTTDSRPEWRPRIRNYNGTVSVDGEGVATIDLATGDMFFCSVSQDITRIRCINVPGDTFQGNYIGFGRDIAIDVFFQMDETGGWNVAMPDGVWRDGAKYAVPNDPSAMSKVHMVVEASANPDNEFVYLSYAYGEACADVSG